VCPIAAAGVEMAEQLASLLMAAAWFFFLFDVHVKRVEVQLERRDCRRP